MNRYLWIGLSATLFVLLVVHTGAAPTEVHEDAVASQDETSADIESPIGKPSIAVGDIAALRVRRSKKGGGYGCSTCGYVPIRTGGCGTSRCGGGGGGGGYSNAQSSSTGSASSGTYGRKK
ncbi:uncharacterized protein LOC126162878 [Schistocerca cancellata]|uniref:uncharacterized protein LOC126162878 n=1 Tax=Schistocerca cancellata TaxID=274614 RepID=UPI0021192CE8|nr:uncharacterized protein LOC126162878 [Schistocerca cancellata]